MLNCVAQHLPQNFLQNTWKLFGLHVLPQAGAQHCLQPPLIPEYAVIEWTPEALAALPYKVLQAPWIAGDTDKGENDKGDKSGDETKVNKASTRLVGTFRDTDKGENDKGYKSGDETKVNESLYKTGWYFSPEKHVELAMRLQHLVSQITLLPDGLRYNIFLLCTEGLHDMAQKRHAYSLHMLVSVHVDRMMQGKPSLYLFGKLLEQTQFPDMEVCLAMRLQHLVSQITLLPDELRYNIFLWHRSAMPTHSTCWYQCMWTG